MLMQLKRYLRKKFDFEGYMRNEWAAADHVEQFVPKFFNTWKMGGVELLGQEVWEKFVNRPAFLGYLFTWCDLIAMSMDAEQGGTGSLSGYVRVLQVVAPQHDAETAVERTIAMFNSGNAEVYAGAHAGHMDYNRFTGASDKSPTHLITLIKVTCCD